MNIMCTVSAETFLYKGDVYNIFHL